MRGSAPGAVPLRVRPRRKRALNRTVYPDSPLRLFFTEPGLAPSGGAKTFQVWDPQTQNPLQDLDGSNALVTDYVMGNRIDEPLGRVAGGATHAFVGDQVMSIRGLVDSAGVQTNRYTYAAFGLGRSQVEAVANRLRFTARELDPATGLQFNRHRHYLASLGRWTQPDPLGDVDGPNRYLYARGNPITHVDPLGLTTGVIEGGVIIGACGPGCWIVAITVLTCFNAYIIYKIVTNETERDKRCHALGDACRAAADSSGGRFTRSDCNESQRNCQRGFATVFPDGGKIGTGK